MPLPHARNETATAATPPKSATINDLQDGQIESWHGERPLIIAPACFHKYDGAAILIAGPWVGVGTFIYPLVVPPGTKIDEIAWYYDRGGAGTMAMAIVATKPAFPFATKLIPLTPASAGTGPTVDTYDSATLDTLGAGDATTSILAADEGWLLQLTHDDAANEFHGVALKLSKGP